LGVRAHQHGPYEPRRYRRDVDFLLRKADFYLNAINSSRFSRFFGITGYPPLVVPLFLGSLWVIWHGPALWRGSSTLIGFLVTVLLGRVLAPTFARQRSLLQYLALLLLLSWLLVWIHAENATEADGGCYRHVLAPIIGLTSFAAAFVAPLLAKLLIAWYRGQFVRRQALIDPNNPPDTLPEDCGSFGDFLPTTEMFFIPVKPKFRAIGFMVSLLPTLTRYALPVCWAAAVAGVLVPQRVMHIWLLVVGAAGVLFFAVGNLLGGRDHTGILPLGGLSICLDPLELDARAVHDSAPGIRLFLFMAISALDSRGIGRASTGITGIPHHAADAGLRPVSL
jgi:hypothetical protein